MREEIIGLVNTGKRISPHKTYDSNSELDSYRLNILANIDALHARSRQGLWGIAAFILISIGALLCRDLSILEACPEPLREILGCTPPAFMIHIILAISTISALILIAGRMESGVEPGSIWSQLLYRSIFYLVYFLSDVLAAGFAPIFLCGLSVLLFEYFHIWRTSASSIREEREQLRKLSLWPLVASTKK